MKGKRFCCAGPADPAEPWARPPAATGPVSRGQHGSWGRVAGLAGVDPTAGFQVFVGPGEERSHW